MVYRERKFTKSTGDLLATRSAKPRATRPFDSEIFAAIETVKGPVRYVQTTLTGDPEYGRARPHSTHNNLPPKGVKLRTWDTIPLWK